MNLVISMATRGRPDQMVDTIRKSVANWTHPETIMQVQLDHDDPAPLDYLTKQKIHERVLVNVQQREDTIADKWNRAMSIPAQVYLVVGDDDPYVTPGYDTKILEAAKRFPDGIGMVYGGLANLSFTGSVAMTERMAKMLGYIQPPYFPYWFVDHWTDDVARMIGRISYADIRTDQSRAGKTQEFREPWWWATYFDAHYLTRYREAERIINSSYFVCDEWLKELLLANRPLVMQRSRILNEMIRQDRAMRVSSSGIDLKEPRYVRIKNKALEWIPKLLADPMMHESERAAFSAVLTPPTTIPALARAF